MRNKFLSLVLVIVVVVVSAMGVFADDSNNQTDTFVQSASEETLEVYNAYLVVVKALESEDRAELDPAIEEFEKVIDIFNELSKEEFEDLAVMLDIHSNDPEYTDGEYAANVIFADWFNINILNLIDEAYSAFISNPNADTAEAMVEMYEQIFPEKGESAYISDTIVYAFFPDIDDVYAKAAELVETDENADADKNNDTDAAKETDADTPQTGDKTDIAGAFAILIASAFGAAFVIKRRKIY